MSLSRTVQESAPVIVPSAPRLAYRTAGNPDGPTICLLHSLGTSGAIWNDTAGELAGRYSLLIPDLRGHGYSSDGEVTDVAEWADDLERVLDHAGHGPDEPVVLVGVSLGGIQAIAFAATRPARVAALVVADSFAFLPPDVSVSRIAAQTEQVRLLPMAQVAERYVAATFADTSTRGAGIVRREMERIHPGSYLAAVRTCFGADVRHLLGAVSAPTLVLWGDRDDKTPRALSDEIASGIRGSELRVVADAGHLAPLDNPSAFARDVTNFLQRNAHTRRRGI